jgi:hypothetical protein
MVTPASLKKWAYAKKSSPLIDLLEVSFFEIYAEDLITYLNDQRCPQRLLILDSFYKIVGHSISKNNLPEKNSIQQLVNRIQPKHGPLMNNWAFRARIILKDMRKYDYIEWCDGGFSNKDIEKEEKTIS